MSDILQKIVAVKHQEVAAALQRQSLASVREAAETHPHYGWDRNAGYGTAEHMEALRMHGPTPLHRRSFAPVRLALTEGRVAVPVELATSVDVLSTAAAADGLSLA